MVRERGPPAVMIHVGSRIRVERREAVFAAGKSLRALT